LAPHRHFEGLEIATGNRSWTYEGFDLAGDLEVERSLEPLFSAASAATTCSIWASAQSSLACQ
jgi:hypothetical protein